MWRIIVKDTNVNEHNGTFLNWRLNLWGEAIDGTSQTLHPLPGASESYGTMTATFTTSHASNTQSAALPHSTQSTEAKTTVSPLPTSSHFISTLNHRLQQD